MSERVWSRQDIEDRVSVLRERYDGKEFADAVASFSKELDPEEQDDLREVLLERSRELGLRNAALDDRIERGGWLRRTLGGSSERALRREKDKNRRKPL